MKNDIQPRRRLIQQDWIEVAIEMLAESGIGALSIDQLAKNLGVTRGSFYHHFSDRSVLLRSVLEYWAKRWTYAIINQIGELGLDPSTTLLALMKAIHNNRAAGYDAPIRAWALHDPLAQEVVRQVDEARLSFIHSQFEALGYTDLDAENRTRLYLYYEITAPAMFAAPSADREEQLLLERHRFLTAAHVD